MDTGEKGWEHSECSGTLPLWHRCVHVSTRGMLEIHDVPKGINRAILQTHRFEEKIKQIWTEDVS